MIRFPHDREPGEVGELSYCYEYEAALQGHFVESDNEEKNEKLSSDSEEIEFEKMDIKSGTVPND